MWLLTWWRTQLRKGLEERLTAPYLAVALLAVAVVALTGHLGGILSCVETSPG
jgi:uncharacterized membrane protein